MILFIFSCHHDFGSLKYSASNNTATKNSNNNHCIIIRIIDENKMGMRLLRKASFYSLIIHSSLVYMHYQKSSFKATCGRMILFLYWHTQVPCGTGWVYAAENTAKYWLYYHYSFWTCTFYMIAYWFLCMGYQVLHELGERFSITAHLFFRCWNTDTRLWLSCCLYQTG